MNINILRQVALAQHLNIKVYKRDKDYYHANTNRKIVAKSTPVDVPYLISDNYYVMTEEERDKTVRNQIEEDLWLYPAEELAKHMNIPKEAAPFIETYCGVYESKANKLLKKLIVDYDEFVDDCIGDLGEDSARGLILWAKDGKEYKETVMDLDSGEPITFYIYELP